MTVLPHTDDTLLHGRLVLRQPAAGLRVNIDAMLLAAFAATATAAPRASRGHSPSPFPRAADLGAGTGAVGLLLRHAETVGRCLLVEAEPVLAALARDNVAANGMAGAVAVREADLREPFPPAWHGRCDLVVANPPYLALAEGRASPDPLRAAARHETRGGLREFADAARRLLRPDGTLALIYPWRRHAFARECLGAAGWHAVRERRHRPREDDPPVTFCLEARPDASGAGALIVEEIVLHPPGRRFSALIERFLDGDYASATRIAASSTAPARTIR